MCVFFLALPRVSNSDELIASRSSLVHLLSSPLVHLLTGLYVAQLFIRVGDIARTPRERRSPVRDFHKSRSGEGLLALV